MAQDSNLPPSPQPRPLRPLTLNTVGNEVHLADASDGQTVKKRTSPQSPSTSTQTPPEFSVGMGEVDHADYYRAESFCLYCRRHIKMVAFTAVFSLIFILVCCWTGYCAYFSEPNILCYEHQYKVLVVVACFTAIAASYGILAMIFDMVFGNRNRTGFTFNTTGFSYR